MEMTRLADLERQLRLALAGEARLLDGAGKRARRSGPEVSTALPGRNARLAATVPLWHSSRSILGDRPS